ncbi:MAG: potassium-transporting ATPase subunit B, partial [Rhodospirillales bacterium]|nr:potassium-transporting ATPase subunit B [Rhodospirillales bacterium]
MSRPDAAAAARIADPALIAEAMRGAFAKLDPRVLAKNPVICVVAIVSLLCTVLVALGQRQGASLGFSLQTLIWLWATVLFANFAEAMAEGRGKAQAATLRRARTETMAQRLPADDADPARAEEVPAAMLRVGDCVIVTAGEIIPGDGEVIAGAAFVDEAAITGESAPVVRESGGDRSAVTGGTRVLTDTLRIRITRAAGDTFLDRMIALVEGASRQKTPNEIALAILLAGL